MKFITSRLSWRFWGVTLGVFIQDTKICLWELNISLQEHGKEYLKVLFSKYVKVQETVKLKKTYLLLGGRAVLINSVFDAMPTYI